ncbi:MAG TPA: Tex-like N-terminal domain-containing protein, partial [Halanaerobiales bacterium]|nr:Tex-like N-terminal domain-containing protein [Halanaerobiales bacterium]
MKKELLKMIASELNLKQSQVKGTVGLLEEGNTVPFIARYRKEMTGGLTEIEIRKIEERMNYLRNLEERKKEVIRLIDEQDKLTDELEEEIRAAGIIQEVEDLYRPYRQKRHTRASKAKKKGLEPLAMLIWEQSVLEGNPIQEAEGYLNPDAELEDVEDVFQGARDIVAGMVSDEAAIRKKVRKLTIDKGLLESKLRDSEEGLDVEGKYRIYYDYKEAIRKLPPHRILAINRGEEEEVLQIKIE